MDQSDTSKNCTFTSIIPNEQPSTTIYGQGYVYMGPLASQYYRIPSKCVNEIEHEARISTEISPGNNQYQFKVMLLGDSGVGKFFFPYYLISCYLSNYR
jgi:hypothetical protein